VLQALDAVKLPELLSVLSQKQHCRQVHHNVPQGSVLTLPPVLQLCASAANTQGALAGTVQQRVLLSNILPDCNRC
jgi:hypothetical protein